MADVKFDEMPPFRIRIMDGDRVVTTFDRIISSSSWNTLDDVRSARLWTDTAEGQEEARELIARQEREARMFAASPELYEACRYAVGYLFGDDDPMLDDDGDEVCPVERMRAALAKAEGQS